ncbi:MAG: protein phosphatase 2C domain-containing protein [bacterium]|nr:protein phosphatase 2C domain-containing protein [bacterium]
MQKRFFSCVDDIINNRQQNYKSINYYLKNMCASSHIGRRKNQEDSILIMEHPSNKNFKLLAVADGMGGLDFGGKASNIAVYNIINWFVNAPFSYYYTEIEILQELKTLMNWIDINIRHTCNAGGTTLSLAIVSSVKTFFINIGDSRIYTEFNNHFVQITNDASIAWLKYMNGTIQKKDDIRFHKENNLIISRLGCTKKLLSIETISLNNNQYDNIFLFTDGITDSVSDNDLKRIIDNSSFFDKPRNIIEYSINNFSLNNKLSSEEYYNEKLGGDDNMSVAILTRRI